MGNAGPVDVDGFRAMMREAGADEAVDSILATFVADAPGRSTALADAMIAGNPAMIRETAHAFKSSACAIRAHSLATVLLKIELAAYNGRVHEARALAGEAQHEADTAVMQLNDYLSALPSHA